MNKELVEKVRRNFDLNIYETKVWLALLEKGAANIASIHELSKVPRSRIYDVLKSLETKGFCLEKLGKPIKYLAVEPSLVIEKLKKTVEEEGKERIEVLNKVVGSEEYKQLRNLYESTFNITDKVGTAIRGKANLLAHLVSASKNAEERVVLVSSPKAIEKKLSVLLPTLANRAKRGVKVTIGVTNSGMSSGTALPAELQEKLEKANMRVKQINSDANFCIIDNNILLITTPESESRDETALWLQSGFFASTLAGLLKK